MQCEHGVINVTNAFWGRVDRTSCLFANMNWGYGGFCGACFTNCSAGEFVWGLCAAHSA